MTKRKSGRPVLAEGENVKEKILLAYLEICQTEGIEFVTLQKIADRSGVALTSVRYHYNQQGLSLSRVAIEYVADTSFKFMDIAMQKARQSPQFDPVKSYIETTFAWIESEPLQASFLVYYYYLSTTQVPLLVENKGLTEIAHRRILGFIYEGLGMKVYRTDGDPAQISEQIQLIVMGACMNSITSRNTQFADRQKSLCLELAAKLLGVKDL